MFRSVFLALLIIATTTVQLLAQGPAIRGGERVRVELLHQSASPLEGTVIGVSQDVLLLRTLDSDAIVHLDSIARLEMSGGKGNRSKSILKNGAAGLLVGAAGGALIGPLLWSTDCYSSTLNPQNLGGCFQAMADGQTRLEAATYFGIAGALIGGLFGAVLKTDDRWDEVRVDGMRLAIAPRVDGRLAVGVTVAF